MKAMVNEEDDENNDDKMVLKICSKNKVKGEKNS